MTMYLTATLSLLASSTTAATFQHGGSYPIVKRQAIPDRHGNTGNGHASVSPEPASPLEVATSTSTWPSPISGAISSSPTGNMTTITTSFVTMTTSSSIPQSPVHTSTPSTPSPISTTISATPSPSHLNPWIPLHDIKSPTRLNPGIIAGITLGSTVFLALFITTLMLLHRRKRAREIKEIIRPHGKAQQRFGHHYDAKIARSRSKRWMSPREEISGSSVSSWGSLGNAKLVRTYDSPISPSLYSLPRASAVTFGSLGSEPSVFTGTPSQLLCAPRPLFVKGKQAVGVRSVDAATREPRRTMKLENGGDGEKQ